MLYFLTGLWYHKPVRNLLFQEEEPWRSAEKEYLYRCGSGRSGEQNSGTAGADRGAEAKAGAHERMLSQRPESPVRSVQ